MRVTRVAVCGRDACVVCVRRWVHQFDFKTPSERGCELTYVNTVGLRPSSAEHQRLVGEGRVPTAEETIRMASTPT